MQIAEHFGLTDEPFSGQASHAHVLKSPAFKKAQADILDAIDRGARLINLTGPAGVGKTILLQALTAKLSRHALHVQLAGSAPRISSKTAAMADVLMLEEVGEPAAEATAALERLAERPVKPVIIVASDTPLSFDTPRSTENVALHLLTTADARDFIVGALQSTGGRGDLFSAEALELAVAAAEGRVRRLRTLAANAMFDATFEEADRVETHHVEAALDRLPTLPSVAAIAAPDNHATNMSESGDAANDVPISVQAAPDLSPAAAGPMEVPIYFSETGDEPDLPGQRLVPWIAGSALAASIALAAIFFAPDLASLRPMLASAFDDASPAPTRAAAAPAAIIHDPRPEPRIAEMAAVMDTPTKLPSLPEPAAAEETDADDKPAEPEELQQNAEMPELLIRYADRQDGSAELALETAAYLRARGYQVSDVATAPFGVGRGSTRYFAPERRDLVAEINRQVSRLLTSRGYDSARVMDMTGSGAASRTGDLIEVWVPGNS